MKLDNFGRSHLKLTLEINKHIDGYIDAYIGPTELKTEVEATPPVDPGKLLDEVGRLQSNIPGDDPVRHKYLTATLRAIECTVRMLNGEQFDFLDEAGRLYDITPAKVDETLFQEAHNELETLLPGSGSIADRLEARRRHYELEAARVLPLLELARAETRQRTAAYIELPEEEGVEVRLTQNQPWSAYNWYLGQGKSLIEFNTDIPVSSLALIGTFAHEGYPGHHTEALLKERRLYWGKGYAEHAALLLASPAAVIAEGIATTAVEIIFPGQTHHEWNTEILLPAAGITPDVTADEMRRISRASQMMRYVSGNAAILYYSGQLNREQTIDYIQTYALSNRERAEKTFSFISRYRSYGFTYTEGYDLIERASPDGDKRALFSRLLTEQVLPSELRMSGA